MRGKVVATHNFPSCSLFLPYAPRVLLLSPFCCVAFPCPLFRRLAGNNFSSFPDIWECQRLPLLPENHFHFIQESRLTVLSVLEKYSLFPERGCSPVASLLVLLPILSPLSSIFKRWAYMYLFHLLGVYPFCCSLHLLSQLICPLLTLVLSAISFSNATLALSHLQGHRHQH